MRLGNIVNADLCVVGPVSELLVEALAAFALVGDHLVSLDVTEDFGLDLGLNGAAYGQGAVLVNQEDFCELDLIADIPGQLRHVEALVLLYPELLAGDLNYCEHNPKLGLQK
jgi:hypothetical protein